MIQEGVNKAELVTEAVQPGASDSKVKKNNLVNSDTKERKVHEICVSVMATYIYSVTDTL
jgi:hypothetical protein